MDATQMVRVLALSPKRSLLVVVSAAGLCAEDLQTTIGTVTMTSIVVVDTMPSAKMLSEMIFAGK